jgi:hypothetical protein
MKTKKGPKLKGASWEDKRAELRAIFTNGEIQLATREELEEFLVVLANAGGPGGYSREDYKAETERQALVVCHLLQVRLDVELHWRSLWISVSAIVISIVALVVPIWSCVKDNWKAPIIQTPPPAVNTSAQTMPPTASTNAQASTPAIGTNAQATPPSADTNKPAHKP